MTDQDSRRCIFFATEVRSVRQDNAVRQDGRNAFWKEAFNHTIGPGRWIQIQDTRKILPRTRDYSVIQCCLFPAAKWSRRKEKPQSRGNGQMSPNWCEARIPTLGGSSKHSNSFAERSSVKVSSENAARSLVWKIFGSSAYVHLRTGSKRNQVGAKNCQDDFHWILGPSQGVQVHSSWNRQSCNQQKRSFDDARTKEATNLEVVESRLKTKLRKICQKRKQHSFRRMSSQCQAIAASSFSGAPKMFHCPVDRKDIPKIKHPHDTLVLMARCGEPHLGFSEASCRKKNNCMQVDI